MDAHAQWEIQEYGRVMAGMLKRVAPLSYEAWIDYDVCGTHVSRAELSAMRALVGVDGDGLAAASGARLDRAALEGHGLAKREIDELLAKLAPAPAVPDFELDVASARSAEHFAERFAAAVPERREADGVAAAYDRRPARGRRRRRPCRRPGGRPRGPCRGPTRAASPPRPRA